MGGLRFFQGFADVVFEDFVDFVRPDGLADLARPVLLRRRRRVLFQLPGVLDRLFKTRAQARS
jgi:hypothetical protein